MCVEGGAALPGVAPTSCTVQQVEIDGGIFRAFAKRYCLFPYHTDEPHTSVVIRVKQRLRPAVSSAAKPVLSNAALVSCNPGSECN
jgi:hypothetical protein